MDIQYLLFLQDIRAVTGGVFDEFFNAISKAAEEPAGPRLRGISDRLLVEGIFRPGGPGGRLGRALGNLLARFILWFFIVAIWPVFIWKWAED